jgi:para-nitrobenzyl esterase
MTTAARTTAQTSYGALQGTEDGGVLAFRGVPFAQPPVGPLRFRAPERAEPWSGVRDATRFGPAAMQANDAASQMLGIQLDQMGEDCLYLNVWTPGLDGRRPVMVFIHGGAFILGAGSQKVYNGAPFAARGDVVCVTINYRLGAFGFLRGQAAGDSTLDAGGNEGMLDQMAALRWVREEIAAFGGDPDNITIFGESAGSISVAALLTMPAAKGLFHKAILQSGSLNLLTSPEAAGNVTTMLLNDLGIAPAEAGRLRDLPADELLRAQARVATQSAGLAFGPVADGDAIPAAPFEAIADGSARGVPILVGTNRDEAKLFALMDPTLASLDDAGLRTRLVAMAGAGAADRLIETYRGERSARGESTTAKDLWAAISSDFMFRAGAMRLAELHARHSAAYAYLFTWESPALGGALGAAHALELPFVFNTLDSGDFNAFIGPVTPEMRALANVLQDTWTAFARTGKPAASALPAWEGYTAERRTTMLLGSSFELVDAPLEAERAVWEHTS